LVNHRVSRAANETDQLVTGRLVGARVRIVYKDDFHFLAGRLKSSIKYEILAKEI